MLNYPKKYEHIHSDAIQDKKRILDIDATDDKGNTILDNPIKEGRYT